MVNNSIQNILLNCSDSYLYISDIMNKICKAVGLEVLDNKALNWDVENIFIGADSLLRVQKLANCAIEKGIINAIVVNGADKFPFLCPFEESIIAEAWKNKIFSYTVNSKVLGIKEVSLDKIKCENIEHSDFIVREILSSKLKDEKFEIVMINCALSLYISKKADNIIEAMDLFKKIIQTYDLN